MLLPTLNSIHPSPQHTHTHHPALARMITIPDLWENTTDTHPTPTHPSTHTHTWVLTRTPTHTHTHTHTHTSHTHTHTHTLYQRRHKLRPTYDKKDRRVGSGRRCIACNRMVRRCRVRISADRDLIHASHHACLVGRGANRPGSEHAARGRPLGSRARPRHEWWAVHTMAPTLGRGIGSGRGRGRRRVGLRLSLVHGTHLLAKHFILVLWLWKKRGCETSIRTMPVSPLSLSVHPVVCLSLCSHFS